MLNAAQVKKATRLNRLYATSLKTGAGKGWIHEYDAIVATLGQNPDVAVSAEEFAQLVANWQTSMGVRPVDGIIGIKTWTSLSTSLLRDGNMCRMPPDWLVGGLDRHQSAEQISMPVQAGSPVSIPGRGFMFVMVEVLPEVGSTNLVRKVAVIPKNYAMMPRNAMGVLRPAEHALNLAPEASQFLSASNMPSGAATMQGKGMVINIEKVVAAGGRILQPDEVIGDLQKFASQNPASKLQVDKLVQTIRQFEGETLIQGGVPKGAAQPVGAAHAKYLDAAEEIFDAAKQGSTSRGAAASAVEGLDDAYRSARNMGRVGRVFVVAGLVVTAYDVGMAIDESVEKQSFKPIGAETIRQVGGWGGGAAGAKIGFLAGAAVGIETGPGAIITGAVGAIIFGAAGYYGADWVADFIDEN